MANRVVTAAAVPVVAAVLGGIASPQDAGRKIDLEDFQLPDHYHIEAVVTNLSVPTTAIFEGEDLLVAESGTKKTGKPRVLRIKKDGTVEVLAEQGLEPPVTGLLTVGGKLYVSHLGRVSVVEGGALRDVVTGLPSRGDHQNNQIVMGADGKIYIGQGTVTNSGVVGVDNYLFGWLKDQPQLHEVPCQDVTLTGENFESENPLSEADDKVRTGAYKPFGVPSTPGEVVKGSPKCGGSIARFNPDGSGFELVASGLRNPFGLEVDKAGQLWATFHGADVRGSRNIFNDPNYLVKVEPGAWYGWPDFFDGEPVTQGRFDAIEKPKPKLLWKAHPPLTKAFTTFDSHTGVCGLAFSPGGAFGFEGDAFVAMFGTFAPVTTGINLAPGGFRVARVDMKSGEVHDFVKNDLPGPAYVNQQDGFNRPTDTVFAPDGSLYVVDWGASTIDREGLKLVPATGVVWRIYRDGMAAARPHGPIQVQAAGIPREQREPEVPNIPQTYKMVGPTLALVVAAVVLVIVLAVWLWRRRA
jgi:glucose/arabinose dehydrogenase